MTSQIPQKQSTQKTYSHSRIKHHRKRNATVLVVSVALVALVIIMVVMAGHPGVSVGQQAPDFSIPDITGATFHLYGATPAPVLIEFMATRCVHCQNEAPTLASLYPQYSGKVTFLSISIDTGYDTASILQSFSQNHNAPWTWARDANGVATAYGVTGTPTIVLLDSGHIVKFRWEGETSTAVLSNALSAVA